MPKFFIEGNYEIDGVIRIDGENARHITKALRMNKGDKLFVCDGQGTDCECVIEQLGPDYVFAKVTEKKMSQAEPSVKISLFIAMPKADKLEAVVQKAVETGVYEITPFFSKRCVSRPDEASLLNRIKRLNKISEEAAKQSGRGIVPQVAKAVEFSGMLHMASMFELPIMAYEEEREASLKNLLERKGNFLSACIVSGPEGGFTPEEADSARRAGINTVSLGPRILRCETAPVAMLAAIMYHTGNM